MINVLFIGTTWGGLYKDILNGFDQLGEYEVDFIEELSSLHDPFNVRKEFAYPTFYYTKILRNFWKCILCEEKYNKKYDVLLVLDGQGLHPIVFEILRARNHSIKTVNYLFDTNSGVYEFYRLFGYFDKVYTFDRTESICYKINHLPIFWMPTELLPTKYDFFGLGSYSKDRFKLFKAINYYADSCGLTSFVKIYHEKIPYSLRLYSLKQKIRRLLGMQTYIPLDCYLHPMIINRMIPTEQYRNLMAQSRIVVDTSAGHQVGLTARFMWALGLGKKIITNNSDVKNYSFYSPDYIYVVENDGNISCDKKFNNFVNTTYCESRETRSLIDSYRIDNWLSELLK